MSTNSAVLLSKEYMIDDYEIKRNLIPTPLLRSHVIETYNFAFLTCFATWFLSYKFLNSRNYSFLGNSEMNKLLLSFAIGYSCKLFVTSGIKPSKKY